MSSSTNCPSWFAWLLMVAALFTTSAKSYAAPVISGLVPSSAIVRGPAFTLTVNGSGFGGGPLITATVEWNGSARQTTFVSSTRLTAAITANDIANVGTAEVRVRNQARFARRQRDEDELSNTVSFAINNPVPAISSLSPQSALAGGPDFGLTINGSNFVAGSRVRFGNSNRNTTFVSASRLTASIQDSDIKQPGVVSVTVINPGTGRGNLKCSVFYNQVATRHYDFVPLASGCCRNTLLSDLGCVRRYASLQLVCNRWPASCRTESRLLDRSPQWNPVGFRKFSVYCASSRQ